MQYSSMIVPAAWVIDGELSPLTTLSICISTLGNPIYCECELASRLHFYCEVAKNITQAVVILIFFL